MDAGNSQDYFASYEDLEVQETMLRDNARNEAYRNAINNNKSLFKDKIVLDVGAGTGILSILCAQAGARKVFAIEATRITELAKKIIAENNCQDIIELHQIKIEDFQLPEGYSKVDILISEWMGFYLVHEGMLDSIIYARKQFLKPDGHIFPENATIYIAPCSLPSYYDDWNTVSGVKMTEFGRALRTNQLNKPDILTVKSEHLLTDTGIVMSWIDLREIDVDDINEFNFKEVVVIEKSGKYQGVCIWFDCEFPCIDDSGDSIVLSTSPHLPPTHWKQTCIILPEREQELVECRDPIVFSLKIVRNPMNHRRYNLEMVLMDCESIDHPLPCNCILTKCILTKAHLERIQSNAITMDPGKETDVEMK